MDVRQFLSAISDKQQPQPRPQKRTRPKRERILPPEEVFIEDKPARPWKRILAALSVATIGTVFAMSRRPATAPATTASPIQQTLPVVAGVSAPLPAEKPDVIAVTPQPASDPVLDSSFTSGHSKPIETVEAAEKSAGVVSSPTSTPGNSDYSNKTKSDRVWVEGYRRSDGTWVEGHWRGTNDGDSSNNLSPQTSPSRTGIASTPSRSSGSDRVEVKGYYRKDGTYVRPSTRSKPKK